MNSIFDGLPVGKKIIAACGKTESNVDIYPHDEETIVQGIKETIELLKSSKFFPKKKLKDSFLVPILYVQQDETPEMQQNYSRASTQIVIEFLEWLLNQQRLNGQLYVIKDLLQAFVFDLGAQGVLGKNFFSPLCWRSKTNHTFFHFHESKDALFFKISPSYITQESLSVFGLRQAMEIKFRRVLGLGGIFPQIKMRHDVIPLIISDYENKISFPDSKKVTIKEILHIYKWTNDSIHYMKSTYPWLVWKAFSVCRCIFDPNDNGPSTSLGIDSTFQFHINVLKEMRAKLIAEVQRISNEQSHSYEIIWNNPEAFVYDDAKRTLNLNEEKANVKVKITPCE